jgi:hypothetical protein
MATLDNPITLWEHAFENQISAAARSLLLVLVSTGQEVVLEHLASAFASYQTLCSRKYNSPSSPEDFSRALRELEGTFVAIRKYASATTVALHNPSIADFLVHYLRGKPQYVGDIIEACVYHDQLYRTITLLTDGKLTGEGLEPLRPHTGSIAAAVERTLASPPIRFMAVRTSQGLGAIYMSPANDAYRLTTAINLAGCFRDANVEEFIQRRLSAYEDEDTVSCVARGDLVELLEAVEEHEWAQENYSQEIVGSVRSYLLGYPDAWEEVRPVAKWVADHRQELREDEVEGYKNGISEFVDEEVYTLGAEADSAETIGEMQEDLEETGRALGLDFGNCIDYLQERRHELESPDEDYDPERPSGLGAGSGACEISIEAMFDSLRTLPPTS